MSKHQPNADQKINPPAPMPPKAKPATHAPVVAPLHSHPRPEIVEACLAEKQPTPKDPQTRRPKNAPPTKKATNPTRPAESKKEAHQVPKGKNSKKKQGASRKIQGTLGHIFESMEKLGNAICLENGLFKQNDLNEERGKEKQDFRKGGLRLSHLTKRKNGEPIKDFNIKC